MGYDPKGERSTKAIQVIVDLLREQDKTQQPQAQPREYKNFPKETGNLTLGNFFSFRFLISPHLIRILYVLGAIIITIVSWNSFIPDQLLLGILSIIVGNLVWRLGCETLIVFFHLNKEVSQLRIIHNELKKRFNIEEQDSFDNKSEPAHN